MNLKLVNCIQEMVKYIWEDINWKWDQFYLSVSFLVNEKMAQIFSQIWCLFASKDRNSIGNSQMLVILKQLIKVFGYFSQIQSTTSQVKITHSEIKLAIS